MGRVGRQAGRFMEFDLATQNAAALKEPVLRLPFGCGDIEQNGIQYHPDRIVWREEKENTRCWNLSMIPNC